MHQKVNVLSFLQEKIQRDLCESESNYNAMLKRVEELEDEMIENRNCTVNPHYSLYETAAYINTSLNNLETFVEDVNGRIQNLETEKEKNAVSSEFNNRFYANGKCLIFQKSSCELLIAKQLELLESLERKMFYLRNEMQRIEKMQQEITHAINEPKHKKWF